MELKSEVSAYVSTSSTSPLALSSIARRAPRSDDIVISVRYCGVCHTDIHNTRNDWGNAKYPMVPGHEIVGDVIATGEGVTAFKVGEIVGVGVIVDSCLTCAKCFKGFEQYCERGATSTYNNTDRIDGSRTYGGYAETIVVSERFVLKMPEQLDLAGAAPLLCAGITTYSPLRHWNVGQGTKVAVVGLGGLGHMAIKMANAMGAEVTLITRSPEKGADARRFGAHDVLVSTNADAMNAAKGQFDLIIDTVPYQHDINPYVTTVAVGGTLVLLGYFGPIEPPLNCSPMVSQRKSVGGSLIGGMRETQEMLDFCGEHDITCEIELIAMKDINYAYERMLKSDVRYRFVIDLASLPSA